MTDTPRNIHEIADRIIAESRASDEPMAKGSDAVAVVARLRLAICPALLHAVADESEMATDTIEFAEAAECFLATVAETLAGYLGAGSLEVSQYNAALLLQRAAQTVMRPPDEAHGETVDRVKRGRSQ